MVKRRCVKEIQGGAVRQNLHDLTYIKRKKPHNREAFKNILEMTVKLI